jgi:N-acetylglutamate synthase-like GNAT family acetyltransferase
MNIKSGKIDGFEQYSQFSSLKEFNTHMEMWLLEVKQELTKGERVGLKRLVRFAAKIPGVCNAKIGTILKAINEDYNDHGISRSTFKRMVLKAKDLGILTVYETERKNGSQSSNLYIFNRFPKNEPPKAKTLNHLNKTNNPLKTNHKKDKERNEPSLSNQAVSTIHKAQPQELDHTFVSDRVPQAFVQLVKCFFPDAKTIEEYWHMVQTAAFRFGCNKDKDNADVLSISILAFKQLIRKLKSTQVVKKPIAFFYGIVTNKFKELVEKHYETKPVRCVLRNGEVLLYDWLNS